MTPWRLTASTPRILGAGFRYLSLLLRREGVAIAVPERRLCGRSSLTSPSRVFVRALGLRGLGNRSRLMYISNVARLV